ncbi:glycosyltransferase family 39 protein [Dermacoccaceae bacterium W4C1]
MAGPVRHPVATGGVLSACAALLLALTALSARYGYHRDELYFRMLKPAWGYVDQPPLTPWLARLSTHLADEPWALRIPATAAAVASVAVIALIAREVGADARGQTLAAWGYGFGAFTLSSGHALLTSTIDLLVWPTVCLLVIRALLRNQQWYWVWAGALVGLSTFNKLLIACLVVSLLAGLAIVGPRRPLRSVGMFAGAALAAVFSLPALLYQVNHDWPQLRMGEALSDNNSGEVRVMMWPFLLVLIGPVAVPIVWAGVRALWGRAELRPVRMLVPAFGVLLVLVFAMGSQFYYTYGLFAVLYAVGCAAVTADWRIPMAINGIVAAVISLPVIPVGVLGSTPVPAVNTVARDSVGWPRYAAQVTAAYDALPAADRGSVVVIASNYGEAGALDRFAPQRVRERVVSGHNALPAQAPDVGDPQVALAVGGQAPIVRMLYASCARVGELDNGVGVDNEEQGEPIIVCRGPKEGWSLTLFRLRHLD